MTPLKNLFNDVAYQIMRLSDNLYSAGGMRPSFYKRGKVWKSKSALKLHFNLGAIKQSDVYKDCIVIRSVRKGDDIVVTKYNVYDWIDLYDKKGDV